MALLYHINVDLFVPQNSECILSLPVFVLRRLDHRKKLDLYGQSGQFKQKCINRSNFRGGLFVKQLGQVRVWKCAFCFVSSACLSICFPTHNAKEKTQKVKSESKFFEFSKVCNFP